MGCTLSTTTIVVSEGPKKESQVVPVAKAEPEPQVPEEGSGDKEEIPEKELKEETNAEALVIDGAEITIEPEWTKSVSSMTWAASEMFAAERNGRLLAVEEAKSFLRKRGSALYPGEDQWVAVIRQDGGKDWVQVGDKHHPVGKSHVDEGSGYPWWGDDSSVNPPFTRSVLWLAGADLPILPPKPQWSKHGHGFTWRAAKDRNRRLIR